MTILRMAASYRHNSDLLRLRMIALRDQAQNAEAEEREKLEQRIRELNTLYRETQEIARVLERYYDRGIAKMAGGSIERRPAASWRDNRFLGDVAAWMEDSAEDNEEQLDRLRRNLRKVRDCELTPRQAEMIHLYYDLGLTMAQVAERLGVDKSSVSRTLARGRKRLKRYLQYSW